MTKSLPTFTRAEVAKHCKPDDCFIILHGKVYDVTRFAGMHPGGEKLLLEFAGKDATEDFDSMHRYDVLEKYGPRLVVGVLDDYNPDADDVDGWSSISKVPFAEPGYWMGMHSPYYTDAHKRYRLAVREFLAKEVRPAADEGEVSGDYPELELQQKLGEFGILASIIGPGPHLQIPKQLPGGVSIDEFDYFMESIVHEEMSRMNCSGFEDGIQAGMAIGLPPVLVFGSSMQLKMKVAQEVLLGKKRICLAITEPFVGSDVAGMKTTAVKSADGSHYIVNGTKKWITNGTFADYFVTAVRTGGPGAGGISLLLIDLAESKKGLDTKRIRTSYSPSAGTAYITFEDVKVPVGNLLGKENKGFQCVMFNFNHERWVICSAIIAKSRYIIEECFKWAMQRKVFGKRLIAQPVIREKLAKMVSEMESTHAWFEQLTFQMTKMSYEEQSKKLGGSIALLKYKCTRMAHNVGDDAVQIFGGRGITQTGMGKYIERFQRTYKFGAVYGGSEEIMADLAIRQATRQFPKSARL